MRTQSSTLILSLAYLAFVAAVVFAAGCYINTMYVSWRKDSIASEKRRWETVDLPGTVVRNALVVAEETDPHRAQLLLVCSSLATLHIVSKTIIDIDAAFKPHDHQLVPDAELDVGLMTARPIRVALPGAVWYFIDGIDLVASPGLSEDQTKSFLALYKASGTQRISMSHSETAIHVLRSKSDEAVNRFVARCSPGQQL